MSDGSLAITRTKLWIREFVLEYSLCPFAGEVYQNEKILYTIETSSGTHEQLIAFWNTVHTLDNSGMHSTAILILDPGPVLFDEYLDLFDKALLILKEAGLDSRFQLAGFHPLYRFDGEDEHAPGNFVNRSPYPLIHILFVDEVKKAIDSHASINDVPVRNKKKMEELGLEKLQALLAGFQRNV